MLTAIEINEKDKGQKVKCQCDSGNKDEVSAGNLTSGKTRSCGCLLVESRKIAIKKALHIM